ncbi:endonuclease SmrB [Buchnera aphidicola]|uniref:endonuclease SmrB n=1 Tax=Buchnera aphidicola TaxID=9 RepID=UPI0022389A11|nr:endonuclease SmrB [Buchnera aphidicola]MCW5197604.1 endonuclease SmrB [Buchnera aphidicola (Chaitophorus viminalis)]
MSKQNFLKSKEKFFFREYFKEAKKMIQDTIYHVKNNVYFFSRKKRIKYQERLHSNYFSCSTIKNKFNKDPLYYCRYDFNKKNLNKLKKGYYVPEVLLDVHGFNQDQTKKELGKLIYFCIQKKINCINIMHGYGKKILKKNIPIWLSRHPNVIAFHQAPKILGYDAAILVLIDFL